MKTGNIFKACFTATLVDVRIYPKGNKLNRYIELEVTGMDGEYPPFQKLVTTRGQRKGKIILILQTWDYTTEHQKRKVDWKLASNRKFQNGSQHISKVFPLVPGKAWIDFGTLDRENDIGLIQFDECLEPDRLKSMKVWIVENAKNDTGLIQMFEDNTDFS